MDHKADVSISKVVEWQQKLFSPRDMLRLTDADFDPRPAGAGGGGHRSGDDGGASSLLDQENHHSIAAVLRAMYKDTHFAGSGGGGGSGAGGDVKAAAPVVSEDRRDAQAKLNLAARDWTVAVPFRLFTKVHNGKTDSTHHTISFLYRLRYETVALCVVCCQTVLLIRWSINDM